MKNKLPTLSFALALVVVASHNISINAQEDTPVFTENASSEVVSKFDQRLGEKSVVGISALIQANEEGVAIDGYDPVAYFDQGKAVPGEKAHNCEYLGKQWYFSSAENRDKFLANPDKFAPQYGGYCAHSVGSNRLVRSNPESFAIRDGQLHLYVNDRLAEKDLKKDKIKFSFDKQVRDNNWLTFQSDF